MFVATVDHVFVIRGRGIVVAAILVEGQEPRVGTLVAIQAAGQPRIVAEVRGVEMDVPPPRFAVLLREVAVEAVPIGAQMTEASLPDSLDTA